MKTILTNAKFLLEKCVGCKTCTHVCPTKAYTPTKNRPVEKLKLSPCAAQCPVGNDIEGFVALVGQQRYLEAYDLLFQTNPFPGTTGRVCHHPCEQGCNRGKFDGEVSIQALERFVSDHARGKGYVPVQPETRRETRIAVIGSGPAGLSGAFHLGRMGYRVTVFEGEAQPGGKLRYGIPAYRLPKDVLDWEIGNITAMNVEILCRQKLGENFQVDDLAEFGAVFIALGFQKSRRLLFADESMPGVYPALELLSAVNAGQKVDLGARVAVIGGGNSAIDAARCILRLGSRPVILYRRSLEEMPALEAERRELEREGVEILPFSIPVGLVAAGGAIRQIRCLKTTPKELEKDGRRIPVPIQGSDFFLDVDHVVVAVGETPDLSGLDAAFDVKVDRLVVAADGVTVRGNIFAGGDVATGDGTVSEAIGSGKKGAMAIHRFLEKKAEDQNISHPEVVGFEEMNPDYFYPAPKVVAGHLEVQRAVRSFDETCLGYAEAQAVQEAHRCFGCAAPPTYKVENCRGCVNCAERCPAAAITIETLAQPFTVGVDPGRFDPDEIMRICRKANVHPKQVICYCTDTRAGEVVAAILGGAKTPEDVSLMTGARTGCTVLCVQSIIKLLEAAGEPVKTGETHQIYGKTFTLWDVDRSLKQRDEKRGYHFDDDKTLIEKVFENK